MIRLVGVKIGPTAIAAALIAFGHPVPLLADSAGIALSTFIVGAGVTYPVGDRMGERLLLGAVSSLTIVACAMGAIALVDAPLNRGTLLTSMLVVAGGVSTLVLLVRPTVRTGHQLASEAALSFTALIVSWLLVVAVTIT